MVRERERISLPPMDGLMPALKKGAKTFAEAGGEDAYFGDPTAATRRGRREPLRGPGRDPAPVGHGAPRQQGLRPAGRRCSRPPILVRFGDLDAAGIAYYPNLVNFLHEAFEDFFVGHVGRPYPEVYAEGLGFPTVKVEMEFLSPVHYGDHVDIA